VQWKQVQMKKNITRNARKNRKKKPYRTPPKAKARKVVWLNVLPDDKWLKVKPGITVYEALQDTEMEIEGECGGEGTCGKCKIRVVTALGPPDEQEKALLSPEELANGERLACRTRIKKNLVIHTDVGLGGGEFFQILKHSPIPEIDIDPLLDTRTLEVAPPSLEQPDSDFYRLRSALGPAYRDLTITSRCLASLYKDLRRTAFRGVALLHQKCLLAWEVPASFRGRYGIVLDIGTTTLVGKLIDMTDGREISVISRLNSQSRYGSDIISRIKYVREKSGGLKRMRELLLRDLNLIIRRLLHANQLKSRDVLVAVAAGNTTMQHFLLKLDPSGIAEAPFAPVITEGVTFRTKELGLALHPDAMMYVMPSKSGYIGGDLISFILSTGAVDGDRLVMGLDFGTNGEIFLGNRHRMLTCSAAAGPALEGARISRGMIARGGAIESVRVENNQLHYNVIGNIKPKGLCGSGLVDLVAVLLHYGVIDADGLLSPFRIAEYGDTFSSRVVPRRRGEAFNFIVALPEESANNKRILLTQKDIRELQLAKGAVAAGARILMQQLGVGIEDIDTIYLAGALGNYVNPYSAMRLGLIPTISAEKIVSMGNAASAGAKISLLSKKHWRKASEIVEHIEHFELSVQPQFYDNFIEAMGFPEQNLW
jgi:uncharacterized 2Fe-2S/4Fe-4S cluster protein (DUF4445 family)